MTSNPLQPCSAPDAEQWSAGTLLRMLAPSSQNALLSLGTEHHYENGDIMLRESEQSSHVMLLCEAVVKITASLANGRTAFLGIKVGGDVVGEMAALTGQPRCATVTACGDATVRLIKDADFLRYLDDYPDAHLALTRMIMERLRWADKRRIDFNGYPALVRLARVLVELANGYGRTTAAGITFDVGLTQRELGALIGVEEHTTRKELRKLKSRHVISVGYRAITIVNQAELEQIGYGQTKPTEVAVRSASGAAI